ncbi:MAG TPA: hypothetical protein VEV84_07045 [Pyrinomonadaceae bacterium]|jgi:hypothetical protein|nr:hypothetical protein [Pyrinomonadaceae bacterium]
MGDFGYRPRIRLMDDQLTLDPDIVRMMAEIEAQMAARRILQDMLRPNWSLILPNFQSIVSSPQTNIFSSPNPAPSSPTYTPGAGPATPRAGELSDITGAIYQLPAVQRLVTQAHDEGMRQLGVFRREWDGSSTGQRITMVTMATIFAGTLITPIIANQPTRDFAFGLIKGRDIPVPGIDGLSFQILDNGGAITTPLGIPGLSGHARMQFPNSAAPNYEFTLNFDVMEFVRSRSSR